MEHLITRKASEIKAQPISWLVPNVIPERALSILFGLPGIGKSQISMSLAAAVSNGGRFAKYERARQGNVVVLNVEDDPERVLRPRLHAAGARLDRVHIVEGVQGAKGKEVFNLRSHFDALRRKVDEVKRVRLVVIDPVRTDTAGRAGEMTAKLKDFAEAHDMAVLAIMHPKKAKPCCPRDHGHERDRRAVAQLGVCAGA